MDDIRFSNAVPRDGHADNERHAKTGKPAHKDSGKFQRGSAPRLRRKANSEPNSTRNAAVTTGQLPSRA